MKILSLDTLSTEVKRLREVIKQEAGGVAHIWIDDHCYQLGLESSAEAKSDGEMVCEPYVVPVTHIFAEAFDVLKLLPSLQ